MLRGNIFRMSPVIRWAFNWKEWSPSKTQFEHAISCIQNEEKIRLGKFVFRKDIKASLVGRLLMRKFVNEYTGLPYDKIIFARDEYNRPILKNNFTTNFNISFNVSHQGSYTVLVGELAEIKLGVDIMALEYAGGKSISEFFRIMNRNFSTAEWEEIRGSTSEKSEMEQISMFCRHWALKESYVKALGVGIVVDLRSIDFQTNSELSRNSVVTDTVLYIDGIKQDWLFEESLLDSQHCIAVALEKNKNPLHLHNTTFKIIDHEKLLAHSVPLCPTDSQYATLYFSKSEKP